MHLLWTHAAAAFSLGLLGSAHCVAMCSGLAMAPSYIGKGAPVAKGRFALRAASTHAALLNIGRIVQYAILATLAASLGSLVLTPGIVNALRMVGGLIMILMGLHLAGWSRPILRVERGAQSLVRCGHSRIRNGAAKVGIAGPVLAGLFWGAMPCSLVYSTILWAATSGDALSAAAVMLAFGCGTLPAMIATGIAARRLRISVQRIRPVAGVILSLYGVVTLPMVQTLFLPHSLLHSHPPLQ